MNRHLSDEQWAAAAMNELDASAAEHIAECEVCQTELQRFSAAADAAQDQNRKLADLPEDFWRRQREGIHARLATRQVVHPWRRWAWVAAAVVLIVTASIMLSHKRVRPVPVAVKPDPDDALLLSVQQSIRSDLPQALRPAALLTQEIGRAQAVANSR
jgi:predicted anti-sigma-YlaC factor YlaD